MSIRGKVPAVTVSWLARHLNRLPRQARVVLLTAIYALGAALAAVAFHLAVHGLFHAGLVRLSKQEPLTFLLGSFAVVVSSSLVVGWLLNSFCPEAAGSGIPQLKAAFWKDFGHVPFRVAWVKFVAGILSLGGGTSLGREGPSVQLAGAVGSNLAGILGEPKHQRRLGAATGAAAGMAAAFNTPLAAITFVLEEIIGDLNSRLLGAILLASVLGAFVVHGVIGKQPAFILTDVATPTALGYALTPVVAAVAALVGVLFQKWSLRLRQRARQQRRIPGWLRPAVGGVITWGLGVAVFLWSGRLGVFSLGYEDLSESLLGKLGWQVAFVLLTAKLIATVCSYGFGGCGGIFSPTLFFGAMTGATLAGLLDLVTPVGRGDLIAFMVVGMSCTLGAVVRAPVTGILIVFEMTHEFALVPALMLGALVSQLISRKFLERNFYEEVLHQDGIILDRIMPPRDLKSWHSLPATTITNFRPVTCGDLAPEALRQLLQEHRFAHFPLVRDGKFEGVLTRAEIQDALADQRPPVVGHPRTCLTTDPVSLLQRRLIESDEGIVGVLDEPNGRLLGIVTLHDLLRAEVAAAEAGKE